MLPALPSRSVPAPQEQQQQQQRRFERPRTALPRPADTPASEHPAGGLRAAALCSNTSTPVQPTGALQRVAHARHLNSTRNTRWGAAAACSQRCPWSHAEPPSPCSPPRPGSASGAPGAAPAPACRAGARREGAKQGVQRRGSSAAAVSDLKTTVLGRGHPAVLLTCGAPAGSSRPSQPCRGSTRCGRPNGMPTAAGMPSRAGRRRRRRGNHVSSTCVYTCSSQGDGWPAEAACPGGWGPAQVPVRLPARPTAASTSAADPAAATPPPRPLTRH